MKKQLEFKFITDNPDVAKRKEECQQIINQYPEKIPIICEKDPKCKDLADIDKTKYLVSKELSVAQFNYMIRKRIGVKEENSAFYLLINGNFNLTGDQALSEIYNRFKSPDDGFLYIVYASELTWGHN